MQTESPKEIFTEKFLGNYSKNYPDYSIDPLTIIGIIKVLSEIYKECSKDKARSMVSRVQSKKISGFFVRQRIRFSIEASEEFPNSHREQRAEIAESVVQVLKNSSPEEAAGYCSVMEL